MGNYWHGCVFCGGGECLVVVCGGLVVHGGSVCGDYEHSLLYLSLPLCIYPAENIQTSAGDHTSNTRECQCHTTGQQRPIFNCSLHKLSHLKSFIESAVPPSDFS